MLNRCDLKVENVRDRRRPTGRLFQARGPSTARARSPINSLVSRIDAFLRKLAVRFGYASQIQQLANLLSDAHEQLFTKMGASNHCLHQLLRCYPLSRV